MIRSTSHKTIFGTVALMILIPALSMAQPPDPGSGDPFVAPVNSGVAFVAVIAFLYGAYRIYQLKKKDRAQDTKR